MSLANVFKQTYKKYKIAICCILLVQTSFAQEQKTFNSLSEVLSFTKENNYELENTIVQSKIAELNQKSAWANVFTPRVSSSMQMIDNTKQQVLFLPGEVFGQPGTFRSVTTGQKFSSLLNIQPQFEIFNLANIKQINSTKINLQLTDVQSKITEQAIYNQINAIYFNILSFQSQIEIIKQNIEIAENIVQITQNRFDEGVTRKQNLNEAEVNLINLKDNLEQLTFNLQIQTESLALYFENSISPILAESVSNYASGNDVMQTNNTLQAEIAELQLKLIKNDIKIAKAKNLPTIAFISSFNWQNLGTSFFYDGNSNSINYNFIGLRLNMDLPTVAKITDSKNKKLQSQILSNNVEHSKNEAQTNNNKIILEYDKSINQLENFEKIVALKEDTYQKNFYQYQENILELDKLLISQNDLLLAKLNVISALTNIGFSKNRIDINNKF